MIRFDNNLEELNNVDVEQLRAGTPTPQTYSADSRDINRDQPIEMPKVRVPQLIVENSEAIAQFTNLINDINKFMGILRIIKRENKLLNKIRIMLSFNEHQQGQIQDVFNLASNSMNQKTKAIRINAKAAHLVRVYEYIYNHRTFLLDYVVLYLGTIIDQFKLLRDLDYRRLLYTSRQINKCKKILLSSIKEGCPMACKNFVMMKNQENPMNEMSYHNQMNFAQMSAGNYPGAMQTGFQDIYGEDDYEEGEEEEHNFAYEAPKKIKYQ